MRNNSIYRISFYPPYEIKIKKISCFYRFYPIFAGRKIDWNEVFIPILYYNYYNSNTRLK